MNENLITLTRVDLKKMLDVREKRGEFNGRMSGWVPMGFHVVDGPCPPVTFGEELDESGMPQWERFDKVRFPIWLVQQINEGAHR